jgi:D-serine deaminase-like pyridoxal phosphate-dependent protein
MDVERVQNAAEPFITPVAVVDETAMMRNIAAMQARADEAGAKLRPHAKTHKSIRVARRQREIGAVGVTVATFREAEYFASNGIEDIVLAHPPVGREKVRRLADLAPHVRRLAVALDDVEGAVGLPPSVEVLWETDMGYHRVGTLAGDETVEAVARLVEIVGPERFRGLLTHAGHAYKTTERAARLTIAIEEVAALIRTAETLRRRGIEVREISVGSTPTAELSPEVARAVSGMTELRPGTYVYGDANQVRIGSTTLADCALGVVVTVVARPERGRIVVDAGNKALAADSPNPDGYGTVLGHPDWRIDRLSEEHGVILSDAPIDVPLGARLTIVPTHVCPTVNLHGGLVVVPERGEPFWERIEPRGWQREEVLSPTP